MQAGSSNRGFTIVELLIVVVVIGILAAIVIISYANITKAANESAVKNDLAQIAKKVEMFRTTSATGKYPSGAVEMEAANFKVTKASYQVDRNNLYYCFSLDGNHYAFGAVAVGGTAYYLKDGAVRVATAGVNYAGTCLEVDPSDTELDTSTGFTGHAFTAGTGWQNWTE